MYIMYVLSFVTLPRILLASPSSMNHAGPLVLAVAIIAVTEWVASGRKRFILPGDIVVRNRDHVAMSVLAWKPGT